MAQVGTTTCSACGFDRARVMEGKNGTLSIACSECATTAFVKSPNAVMKLRERIAGQSKPAPVSKAKKDTEHDAPKGDDFAKRVFG